MPKGREADAKTIRPLGLPFNDLEYTVFDTDYIDGETNGYDTFMPVDPSEPVPGADLIKITNTTGSSDLDSTYSGQGGDRLVLGTAEIASPFFLRGRGGWSEQSVCSRSSRRFMNGNTETRVAHCDSDPDSDPDSDSDADPDLSPGPDFLTPARG
jgi:hypothetical protein